jgi:hypothetical protein
VNAKRGVGKKMNVERKEKRIHTYNRIGISIFFFFWWKLCREQEKHREDINLAKVDG